MRRLRQRRDALSVDGVTRPFVRKCTLRSRESRREANCQLQRGSRAFRRLVSLLPGTLRIKESAPWKSTNSWFRFSPTQQTSSKSVFVLFTWQPSKNPVNMNLVVSDTPLWYSNQFGPSVAITITYNSQDSLNQVRPFGNKWGIQLCFMCDGVIRWCAARFCVDRDA
jgi:hypothetical protein